MLFDADKYLEQHFFSQVYNNFNHSCDLILNQNFFNNHNIENIFIWNIESILQIDCLNCENIDLLCYEQLEDLSDIEYSE
jgi:hypothetical protein